MNDVVLCVGEPLVVLAPPAGQSLESTGTLAVSIGGAEAHVAVHLARLGVPARFAGRVGDDPFGRRVRETLAREGVDVSSVETDTSRPTGLYAKDPGPGGTVAYYYRASSAASALHRIPSAALDGVGCVHAAAGTSPASAYDDADDPQRWVTSANDKEAHVPIWFTLKIGGAEAAGFFKEATGFDSESE